MDFFIGLWPKVAVYGGWSAVAGGCLAVALLVEVITVKIPFLRPFAAHLRNIALVAAAAIALALFSFSRGVSIEADRCKLQFEAAQKAAVKRGNVARTGATRSVTRGVQDSRDTDK